MSFDIGIAGKPTAASGSKFVDTLTLLQSMGLQAIEMGWVRSTPQNPDYLRSVRQVSVLTGIKLSVHGSYYINLNATPENWPKARMHLISGAVFAGMAGATDYVFHPGSKFGQDESEYIPRCKERLAEVVKEVRRTTEIILRPETTGKSAMIGSIEDVLALSDVHQGILPCMDYAHVFARNQGVCKLGLVQTAMYLGMNSLKNMHIHLSGIEYTTAGEKKHLPFSESDFPLEKILRQIHDAGCGGRIICESPAKESDAMVIKNILDSFEVIAP